MAVSPREGFLNTIIIFDEGTGTVDEETADQIQNFMHNVFKKDCTVITISHRMTTIKKWDRIMVLDQGSGSIVELICSKFFSTTKKDCS